MPIIVSGSGGATTYSSTGSYTSGSGGGETTYTVSGSGYTTYSYSGSYTSGSSGSVDIGPGFMVVSASSPAITIVAGELVVSGSSYLGTGASHQTRVSGTLLVRGPTHLSGAVQSKYVYKTGDYTLTLDTDYIVLFNASSAATASLPTIDASVDGITYVVKSIGAGNVHITGAAGTAQIINGGQSYTLSAGYAATLLGYGNALAPSGYEWVVILESVPPP